MYHTTAPFLLLSFVIMLHTKHNMITNNKKKKRSCASPEEVLSDDDELESPNKNIASLLAPLDYEEEEHMMPPLVLTITVRTKSKRQSMHQIM